MTFKTFQRWLVAIWLLMLAMAVPSWAGITYSGTTAQTLYARVQTGASTFVAATLTEGSSGGLGIYNVSDASLVSAGLNTSSGSAGFNYTIRSGTASTTANDTIVAYGVIYWSGSAELTVPSLLWQDSTPGDFTTANSIGKGLYTGGNVPGASNGLFVSGASVPPAASVPAVGWSEAYATPWNSTLAPQPNIATNFPEWSGWMLNRVGQFVYHCPLTRTTTYYCSYSDGSDSNSGLTAAAPFKTLSKVQTVINASSGDVRCRFKRGDVWTVTAGITPTVSNCTLDDYGDQAAAAPLFNRFSLDYTSSTWTNDTGNRWTLSESSTVRWVREIADRKGTTRGTHLIRVASAAAVTTTANSWYWGSGVLYVNLNGDSPNTKKLEAVPQNSDSGVLLGPTLDGWRIQDLAFHGFGCIGSNGGYAIMVMASGTNAVLLVNDEGLYGGTHIMGLLGTGTAGGKLVMLNCKAALTIDPAGDPPISNEGEAHFIAFAALGGQEVWNLFWEAPFGAAKASNWDYANNHNMGTGFAAHSSGTSPQMIVSYGGRPLQGITGVCKVTSIDQNDDSSLLSIADFANAKALEVYTDQPAPAEARLNNFGDGRIKYGCTYRMRPYIAASTNSSIHTAVSEALRCYFVNSRIELDWQNVPASSVVAMFGRESHSVNAVENIHSNWRWFNTAPNAAGAVAIFDYQLLNDATTNPGAGPSSTAKATNSVFAADSSLPFHGFALTNQASKLVNNAFMNMDQTAGKERGYDLGTSNISLSTDPSPGTRISTLLAAGSSGIHLSNDINGKPRSSALIDVGCEDFSSAASVTVASNSDKTGYGLSSSERNSAADATLARTNGSASVGTQLARLDSNVSSVNAALTDINLEAVPEQRTIVLKQTSSGLVADAKTLSKGTANNRLWAVDFRNDIAVNSYISLAATPTIMTGTAGGVTFGTAYKSATQSKFTITGVTVGTYVIQVPVTYRDGSTAEGRITINVVN